MFIDRLVIPNVNKNDVIKEQARWAEMMSFGGRLGGKNDVINGQTR
jgi:hypothetical protein